MGIFGQLDAATIPSNPFFIEKGNYEAQVTKAEFRTNQDNQKQIYIEYTITEEESEYYDRKISQFFTLVDPDMTKADFDLLPNDEKQAIRNRLSNLKRTLCGNDGNEKQRGLGVDPDDLNDKDWDPTVLMGLDVDLNIKTYADNTKSSVNWANIRD